ncbi:MAG: PAS-domain containing protein [Pseudomonadota bacterium]
MTKEPGKLVANASTLSADVLTEMLEGANAGLAVFDSDLNLIFANELYLQICEYTEIDACVGRNLRELASISMKRAGFDDSIVNDQIDRSLNRLRSARNFSFEFKTRSQNVIHVHRSMLSDGRVTELVQPSALASDLTTKNRLEVMVEAARTRMVHAFESMADGFALFDADDRLTVYNKKYIELNSHIADIIAPGMSYEEMLRVGMERNGYETSGRSVDEFIDWRLEKHRNPKESYDLLMHDGRWVRVQERRTHDGGIVGTRTDITELKRREAEILRVTNELRRKNLLFDTALNNMIQGLCMFDADQTLIVTNRRYLEMYGFSEDVVKPGIKLHEIMEYSVSLGNYTQSDAERAKAERPDHAKLRQRATLKQHLRDGRVIAVMHEPMANGGSIATYQDITELERHEAERHKYTRKLEESNRELQDFAYVASHDLQEPLRKIETFGNRLMAKFGNEIPNDGHLFIERINSAVTRMRSLIDDLLTYSLVTTKANPFVKTDLKEVLDGVLSDLQIRIEETNADINSINLSTIDADPLQMRQLFQNIISNALKFQAPGRKPVIDIKCTSIKGDFITGQPEKCEIRISDNGIGFNNKYKEKIFTIFQRLHGRAEYEGTGIGLASVRKIVLRHGGMIDADGIEGEGATFTITLPVVQSDIDDAAHKVDIDEK